MCDFSAYDHSYLWFYFYKTGSREKKNWVKFRPHSEGNQVSHQTAGEKCEEKSCLTEIHGKVIILLVPGIYPLCFVNEIRTDM